LQLLTLFLTAEHSDVKSLNQSVPLSQCRSLPSSHPASIETIVHTNRLFGKRTTKVGISQYPMPVLAVFHSHILVSSQYYPNVPFSVFTVFAFWSVSYQNSLSVVSELHVHLIVTYPNIVKWST
jgi:hypothetical protein